MDFTKEQLMLLNGEIKNVETKIEALYGTLDAEKDTSKVARLEARIQSLEGEKKELISGRNALSDKLQPGDMAEDIKRLLILTEKNNNLHMDMFLYTEGKISQGRRHFGEKVKKVYKAQAGPNCWCLLTNDVLPKQTVIRAHLFKHEWKERTDIIGIDDIDDTRNGLPLWKPIEWALDTSRLCFTFKKETEEFVAHVLDPGIWDLRLVEKGRSLMGHKWKTE